MADSRSHDDILKRLQVVDRFEFEHLVAEVIELGDWSAEVTSKSDDEGVDVIAHQTTMLEKKASIQVKRPDPGNKVGYKEVSGYKHLVVDDPDTDIVVIVTSGAFTSGAYDYAREYNIKLIDGSMLAGLILSYDAEDVLDDYATEADNIDLDIDDVFKPTKSARRKFLEKRPVNFASSVFQSESLIEAVDIIQQVEAGESLIEGIEGLKSLVDGNSSPTPGEVLVMNPWMFNNDWYDVITYTGVKTQIDEEAELSAPPPDNVEPVIVEEERGISVQTLVSPEDPVTRREFTYLMDCADYISESEIVKKKVVGGCVIGQSVGNIEPQLERRRPYGFDATTYYKVFERTVRSNMPILTTLSHLAEVFDDEETKERIEGIRQSI